MTQVIQINDMKELPGDVHYFCDAQPNLESFLPVAMAALMLKQPPAQVWMYDGTKLMGSRSPWRLWYAEVGQ